MEQPMHKESEQSQPDVEIMCRVNQLLDAIDSNNCNDDYNKLRKLSAAYLIKHCNHSIVRDYIDTDVDGGGQTIYYCEKCMHTLPISVYN